MAERPQSTLLSDLAFARLNRKSLHQEIAGKIAALISSGLMQPGEDLPGERDLAQALTVSRETVRKAIKLLADNGIVLITQGARSRILAAETGALALMAPGRMAISTYGLDEVHSVRLVLEAEAVRLAAQHIDDATLGQLERLIDLQQGLEGDALGFLICDREFHAAIYRASANALLSDLAMDLYGYLADRRRSLIMQPGQIAASVGDHIVILDALRQRDPCAAEAAFAAHEARIYSTSRQLVAAPSPKRGKPSFKDAPRGGPATTRSKQTPDASEGGEGDRKMNTAKGERR